MKKNILAVVAPFALPFVRNLLVRCWLHKQLLRLSAAERVLVDQLYEELKATPKRPVCAVIGMVGLVGSGTSLYAHELALALPAAIISNNVIRVRQRLIGSSYANTNAIALLVARELLRNHVSVIMDSDHVDGLKRILLEGVCSFANLTPSYVRVTCSLDPAYQRILTWEFPGESGMFWRKAGLTGCIEADPIKHARIVMLRERTRRTSLHYDRTSREGGTLSLKYMDFVRHEVDVSNPELDYSGMAVRFAASLSSQS